MLLHIFWHKVCAYVCTVWELVDTVNSSWLQKIRELLWRLWLSRFSRSFGRINIIIFNSNVLKRLRLLTWCYFLRLVSSSIYPNLGEVFVGSLGLKF